MQYGHSLNVSRLDQKVAAQRMNRNVTGTENIYMGLFVCSSFERWCRGWKEGKVWSVFFSFSSEPDRMNILINTTVYKGRHYNSVSSQRSLFPRLFFGALTWGVRVVFSNPKPNPIILTFNPNLAQVKVPHISLSLLTPNPMKSAIESDILVVTYMFNSSLASTETEQFLFGL